MARVSTVNFNIRADLIVSEEWEFSLKPEQPPGRALRARAARSPRLPRFFFQLPEAGELPRLAGFSFSPRSVKLHSCR